MRGEAPMRIRPEELRWAQVNERNLQFEPLTRDQIRSIMERGRELHRWYKSHQFAHSLINLAVLILLFGTDYLVLLKLPHLWLSARGHNATESVVVAGLICGALHCWLMYSLGVFTM